MLDFYGYAQADPEFYHRGDDGSGNQLRPAELVDRFRVRAMNAGTDLPPGLHVGTAGIDAGLLAGGAVTQRRDLYRAAVCAAPLADMARYERFGMDPAWRFEYGSADVPAELDWLLAYSPYHHVVPGQTYPSCMFVVFEHDTRVDTCTPARWSPPCSTPP
ncbi:prolyl oligopeptidase family serine peptidase [Nonomuraea cypriaca]|uniref:prolyl oligopeptidase family serine peptidase n=1 Tax=Nonomuraea cypriaca TaxID=1187855 RepID=UPI001F46972C|nr:prolyl oligopeptidase family serine peptidase [Nonomuraea cypriaca]